MTPENVARAADALAAAARDRKRISLDGDLRPAAEKDAVAICERLIAGTKEIGGWKMGAADPAARAKLGIELPFIGAIPSSALDRSPATYRFADMMRPVVESEYAFRMGRDLPRRDKPYTRAEIEDAVEALVIGIEVPESRLADGHGLGGLGAVTDHGGVGRYVLGESFRDWRGIDLIGQPVVLTIAGQERGRGTGASVMGHPVDALTWFANHVAARGNGLKAGQFVSTGSCTGIIPVEAPGQVVADFGPLGRVEATFT